MHYTGKIRKRQRVNRFVSDECASAHRNSMKMIAKEGTKEGTKKERKKKKESANKKILITCFCHRYLPSESVPDKRAKEPLRNDTENGSEDDGDDELELKLDAATDDDDDNDDGNIS